MNLAQQSIETATKQLGVKEKPIGSNSGPEVEIYLKSVGLGKGYSWCMAFIYWVVNEAAKKCNVPNPLKKTAGVLAGYNGVPHLHISKPVPGCIFIMDYGGGLGHTGIVTKVLNNGTIETIEGNTNSDGSREGYEVCKRIRKITKCKGFIKI